MPCALPSLRLALLVAGSALAVSSVANASLLPNSVRIDKGITLSQAGSGIATGLPAGGDEAEGAKPSLLAASSNFNVTYTMLSELVAETVGVASQAPTVSEPVSTQLPAGSEFKELAPFGRAISAYGNDGGSPETAILAIVLLLIGGTGYARHLAQRSREQAKRRPLFPA